jgi:hypothetical protein
MQINIPSKYKTDLEKVQYLYRLYELIQEFAHSIEPDDYEMDSHINSAISIWTKTLLSYRDKLNIEDWSDIDEETGKQRKDVWKKDTRITAKLSDIEGFKIGL